MRKLILFPLVLSLALAFAGCASYVVGVSSDGAIANPSAQYKILGSVSKIISSTFGADVGIRELVLGEAQKTYPTANAVINLTVSQRDTLFFVEAVAIELKY